MLGGLRAFVAAKVVTAGEVVGARDRLRQLMATSTRLGDTILAAFVVRLTTARVVGPPVLWSDFEEAVQA